MGFKEIIQNFKNRKIADKEQFKQAERELRISQMLENRQKSANERELEGYMKEDREKEIKVALEQMRIKKRDDINFNHNCLDTPNITNHVDWEVMKERNMFKGNKNMFSNQPSIHRNNPKLLQNNMRLLS